VLQAAELSDAGAPEAAMAALDEAIRRAPRHVRAYEIKAAMAQSRGDTALAEATLLALAAIRPGESLGPLRLGAWYEQRGKSAKALSAYDEAIHLAPADIAPVRAAVTLLARDRRYAEAEARIAAHERGATRPGVGAGLRVELALAAHDLAGAERAARTGLALATQPSAYLQLAQVLQARGEVASQQALLLQAEQRFPNDLTLPGARAESLVRAGRRDEALALLEALQRRAPDDDAVANNLAYLLCEMRGDPASLERALQLLQRFATSNNPAYLDSLGWVHHRLGHAERAISLLERAQALASGSPLLHLHLGLALHRGGKPQRAMVHLRKAVESAVALPGIDEARRLLARG
jgi:tetratricopeptide (TPR) repeat protein